MTSYDWNLLPAEDLSPQITRRAIHTPALTIARLELRQGAVVPEHNHVHEQIATVERGALEFWFGERRIELRSGQSVAIPPNEPHKVVALEDTVVVDVFSPCREDWFNGADAYLRQASR